MKLDSCSRRRAAELESRIHVVKLVKNLPGEFLQRVVLNAEELTHRFSTDGVAIAVVDPGPSYLEVHRPSGRLWKRMVDVSEGTRETEVLIPPREQDSSVLVEFVPESKEGRPPLRWELKVEGARVCRLPCTRWITPGPEWTVGARDVKIRVERSQLEEPSSPRVKAVVHPGFRPPTWLVLGVTVGGGYMAAGTGVVTAVNCRADKNPTVCKLGIAGVAVGGLAVLGGAITWVWSLVDHPSLEVSALPGRATVD
jgi:hypothetical protein